MNDLTNINDRQLAATLKAVGRNAVPFVAWPGDKARFGSNNHGYRSLPYLGDYVPLGWTRDEVVDFGSFPDCLVEGKGYALTDAWHIGIYTKEAVQ
jgi:hypothetical protein